MPGVTTEHTSTTTSTMSKTASESGQSAPSFSYAQAAKGRATAAAAAAASAASNAPQTSGSNTPAKTSTSGVNTPALSTNGSTVKDLDRSAAPIAEVTSTKEETHPTPSIEAGRQSPPLTSSDSTPSIATVPSSVPSKEPEHPLPAHMMEGSWRSTQSPAVNDLTHDSSERKKGRKGKKDKSAEKEPEKEKEEVKPEVFVPAPPPAVNFWTQRKEETAKTKPVLDSKPAPTVQPGNGESVQSAGTQQAEQKKKGKLAEESSSPTPVLQNGQSKDVTSSAKNQKKGTDAGNRGKEESNGRRSGPPRGSRSGDKEEKLAPPQLPPPVEDATSWPTPETALEEEKRKVQEKVEKDDAEDASSNKPRSKKEWVTVPFTPSVTFNTPIPTRGGRGRGGARGGRESNGRGGHVASGSISGEKATSTTGANATNSEVRDRTRDAGPTISTSVPPNSSKKAQGDSQTNKSEQRKPVTPSTTEKPKAEPSSTMDRSEQGANDDSRRASLSAQASKSEYTQQPTNGTSASKSEKTDQVNGTFSDGQNQFRTPQTDRRSEPNNRNSDHFRDSSVQGQPRDRGEGRPDRGRGGFRGARGGGHGAYANGQQFGPPNFANGHASQPSNSYGTRQNSAPYSPSSQHHQYTGPFAPSGGRGGRGAPPRSQSIPSNGAPIFAPPRYMANVNPAMQQMPPLQTGGAYEYQGQQNMSPYPVNPYVEHYTVLAMVTMQLEYYFSIDNLCKDVYLRKHMDSQGFVFLTFIAGFKRIQSLTQEVELLRYACQESDVIELVIGEDGLDRVRRQDGWEKWVMSLEERDEAARNSGPERFFPQLPNRQRSQVMGPPQVMSPGAHAMSPPAFSPNGAELAYRPYPTPAQLPSNGIHHAEGVQREESPLSAAVPDFTPGLPAVVDISEYADVETTFPDTEVDSLKVVFNVQGEVKTKVPFHKAASRTFSNGSIDDKSIVEEAQEQEKRQGRSLANGNSHATDSSPESLRRSRSPFLQASSPSTSGNAPPVMWVRGQRDQAPVSNSNTEEPYNTVRSRAYGRRQNGPQSGEVDFDMKILYEFWSHFLVRNFNPRMYEEFRQCALQDSKNGQSLGMIHLVAYYDEVLNSKRKSIPEILARHYVEVVSSEDRSKERPGFTKLRAAWRNGALDLKSRKKIDNLVDAKLREELER